MELYGVHTVSIDGKTEYEKRSEIVKRFNTDPTCRVLLFSKVGNVGLNLTCANTVIFLVSAPLPYSVALADLSASGPALERAG